jgi:hypothetical protein
MGLGSQLSDERVRELAMEILDSPPFDRWRAADVEFFQKLAQWIENYAEWMNDLHFSAPGLFWLILLGMLALVLALLAHILWSLRIALSAPVATAPPERGDAPPRWTEEAEELAASGRFLEATHRLALGSVQVLIEKEHIELGRSEANRILRERVRHARLPSQMTSEFLRLLDAFEQQWFRDRGDDPELYRAWQELHGRLASVRSDDT